MAKKHPFMCQKCNSECKIYSKGKKHRVFVCPQCGVLATNPFSFKRSLEGAAVGAAAGAPFAGIGAAPGAIGGAILGGFSGSENTQTSHPTPTYAGHRHSYSLEARYRDAMR